MQSNECEGEGSMTASQTASHAPCRAQNARDLALSPTGEQRAAATGGARRRATGPAWALADVLTVGCGGVATVPASTSAEDVARLVALGVAVVLSCWVTVATWDAGA